MILRLATHAKKSVKKFQDKPDLSVQAVLKEVKEAIFEKGKLARDRNFRDRYNLLKPDV